MAIKNSKHIKSKQTKKHYNKSNNKIAFIVVLIFIIALFMSFKAQVRPILYQDIQIILNNENITNNMSYKAINENNKIYMNVEDVKKFLDNTLYYEEESETYITTSSKKLATLKENSESITINGSTLKEESTVIEKDGQKYIAISEMKNVYDYEFEFIAESNVVTIDNLNKKKVKANLKKATKLKEEMGALSKSIGKLKKGEEVICITTAGDKTKIRTQNGVIGYVKSKLLVDIETIREDFIDKSEEKLSDQYLEYDLKDKDISTFEKRQNIINLILQQAIKNGKMYIKLIYNKDKTNDFERFKIEAKPMLEECGVTLLL